MALEDLIGSEEDPFELHPTWGTEMEEQAFGDLGAKRKPTKRKPTRKKYTGKTRNVTIMVVGEPYIYEATHVRTGRKQYATFVRYVPPPKIIKRAMAGMGITEMPMGASSPQGLNQKIAKIKRESGRTQKMYEQQMREQFGTVTSTIKIEFVPMSSKTESVLRRDARLRQIGGPAPPAKGCAIATAAYGTPQATEINVLRRFRDERLMPSSVGRFFVWAYYKVSPSVAKAVSWSKGVRKAVRMLISPMVKGR